MSPLEIVALLYVSGFGLTLGAGIIEQLAEDERPPLHFLMFVALVAALIWPFSVWRRVLGPA